MILTAYLGSGCEILGNDDSRHADLAAHQRIWDTLSDGTYAFTLQRGCFCIYAGLFDVQVVDYEVVDVIPAWDSVPGVPPEDYHFFSTIEGLFDMLRDAYKTGADEIVVEYSSNGYPESIDIDYIKNAVDDEMSIRVSEVRLSSDDRLCTPGSVNSPATLCSRREI